MAVFNVGVIATNHVRKFEGQSHHTATSSVAKSAYRSGSKLFCERTDQVYDYRRKQGIESHFITLPACYEQDHDADRLKNRETLWNVVEMTERNGNKGPRANHFKNNVTTSREYIIILPKEFSEQERLLYAKQTARQFADRYNMVVDMALHRPHTKGDRRNYHLHMMVTARSLERDKQQKLVLGQRDRRFVKKEFFRTFIKDFRKDLADRANIICRQSGYDVFVEYRSFKERGIERIAQQRRGVSAVNRDRNMAVKKVLKDQEQAKKLLSDRYQKDKTSLAKRHQEKRDLHDKHMNKVYHEKRNQLKADCRLKVKQISSHSLLKKGISFLQGKKDTLTKNQIEHKRMILKQHYNAVRSLVNRKQDTQYTFENKLLKERHALKNTYENKKQILVQDYQKIQSSALKNEQSKRSADSERLLREQQKWNAIKKRWYEEKRVQDHWKAIFKAHDILQKQEIGFKGKFNKVSLRQDIADKRKEALLSQMPKSMKRHLVKHAPDRRHDQALQRATPRGVIHKPHLGMGMKPNNIRHKPYIRGEIQQSVMPSQKTLRYKNRQISQKGDLRYKFKHFSKDEQSFRERHTKRVKDKFNDVVQRKIELKQEWHKQKPKMPTKIQSYVLKNQSIQAQTKLKTSLRHITVRGQNNQIITTFSTQKKDGSSLSLRDAFSIKSHGLQTMKGLFAEKSRSQSPIKEHSQEKSHIRGR